MQEKLPNFIVAGFPKCGSTSLHYYLNEHPDIFMPKQKELHYFTHKTLSSMCSGPADIEVDKFNIKTFEAYKAFYKGAQSYKAVGDVSPSYINYPECIEEIKQKLGDDIKVIVLVRDPIKRAYSNYLHLVRENRETLDFYTALKEEHERKINKYSDFWYYTFNSTYYLKIKAYKEAFKDVMIITTEEMSINTRQTIQAVYSFLGVDNTFMPKNVSRRYNEGGVFEKNIVTKFFFQQGRIRSFIKKCMPITPWMKHIKHKIISRYQQQTPEISQEAESYLIKLLKKDVLKLKTKYGVKVDYWNNKLLR